MTDNPLEDLTLNGLRMRHALGRTILRKLRTDWKDEPGQPDALEKYKSQLRTIKQEIRRRRIAQREANGHEKPKPRTIHAKVAKLGVKVAQKGK